MKNRPTPLFAVAPPGLEECCRQELVALGLQPGCSLPGGVPFVGGLDELYRANLLLRSASRVLVELGSFVARDFPTLFRRGQQLPWGSFLRGGEKLTLRVAASRSRLQHSGRIEETLRGAIQAHFGSQAPAGMAREQLISVRLQEDTCSISIDSSGELLHRRGYRRVATPAPLRENLAAGILLLLAWQPQQPLVDPCCGSGTLVIEAAMQAAGRAPGGEREFSFMSWPGYRQGLWSRLCREAEGQAVFPAGMTIVAADRDPAAIAAARENAAAAGVAGMIRFETCPLERLQLPSPAGLLVANPPYGVRLGDPAAATAAVRQLWRRLKGDWQDWRAGLIMPRTPPGDGWHCRARLRNGGLAVKLWERNVGKRA